MLIATTEQRSHLFHARMSCAEGMPSHYDFPCNRLRIFPISHPPITPLILPFVPIALHQIDASLSSTHCTEAVLLTIVLLLSSLFGEPLRRSLTTRSVSLMRRPHPTLLPSLSRSFLTDLVSRPFLLQHERTTCYSRAHLRQACVRTLLPCATRAARVLRTKSRCSSRFSLVSFSPITAIDASRALAHPLPVTLLSLVAHGCRRPCCAPIARSRSRSSCVLQLVLRVRYAKHAPPPPSFLQRALSPISPLRLL